MNLTNIATIRLISQQIATTKFKAVKDVVDWMGAMQAQDYAMAKWAIGARLPNSTDQDIETAINHGEIIRTHLLRPTWHFASAENIVWMLVLTVPQIKVSLKSRNRELGLSETIFAKSNTIIEKALAGGKHLTRQELITELEKAHIATEDNRASHLMLQAELDGIVCSGAVKGGKQTYALLEERVPKTKPLTREEALAKLAQKYFTSHGPASLQDFVWWSGLSVSDARRALEMVKSDFISETIDSRTYWFSPFVPALKPDKEAAYLLPAFDEFIISYKDRRAALPFEDHNKAVSDNGIFRPVIVVNGKIIGTWKRTIKKDRVIIETQLFEQPDKATRSLVEEASIRYGHFLEKKTEIDHT